ncbi:unnamed protein product [Mytilus coruscus]|uniref:Reverse transcriptase domain-containing protein n=1 Tax=Mytilus coruscus TaxID=42192 RepID=A0A6J8BNT4_MYTCO|nr:unnamed protein product [Mytilus coruscus]
MHTLEICSESDDDELFVATIDDSELNTDEWTETINVNDVPVNFQLDTGAKCNVLSLHKLKTICSHPIITKQVSPLRSYSGHIIDTVGVINLRCTYKCQDHAVKFHIVDRNNKLKQQYRDLFKGLGCLPGTHKIRINKTVAPVVHAPRKIPIAIKDKVKAELDRMEDIGVIFKQQEPTQWVNSMVTVIKPNGKIRISIDPRDLNKAILREHYPLKTVEEVISQMPNAKVFSKLDATSGFWHIQVDEPSSKLCTFNTPFGRYRFARLPFGINSASEVFQKIVSEMVSDIGAEAIIDDILIWGSDQKEHDMRLKQVLNRAREYNLKLSAGKCEISKPEVTYVGHRLTSEGVKPDPEKIRAVNKMSKPECVNDLQTFMGFIQYLGKIMPNMSTVSAPLRTLLEKKTLYGTGMKYKKLEFKKGNANDEHLQELQDVIFDGWPNEKSELLHSLRPYWTFRDELSVIDGLLYKSNKAIVPNALQNEMLDKIHESHLGIVK